MTATKVSGLERTGTGTAEREQIHISYSWPFRCRLEDAVSVVVLADRTQSFGFPFTRGGKYPYRLPFGVLGRVVRVPKVRSDVERIFDYRFRRIQEYSAIP